MIVPHEWPEPVKQTILTGAALLVIVAYALICAGSTLLIGALFSQLGP